MENGLVPKYNKDIEEAVLGALLLEPHQIKKVYDVLNENVFYFNEHKIIWLSIKELSNTNKPIDLLTVNKFLKDKNQLESVGGSYYLAYLTNKVATAANLQYYVRILQQNSISRGAAQLMQHYLKQSYDENQDIFDVIKKASNDLRKLITLKSTTLYSVKDSIGFLIENNLEAKVKISTGFSELDKYLELVPGTFNIIAARPGMGKTDFLVNLAYNIQNQNQTVVIFSLEMSKEQMAKRFISRHLGIDNRDLKKTTFYNQFINHFDKFEDLNIYIDDTSKLNIFDIEQRLEYLKDAGINVSTVFIDYIQLMGVEDYKAIREQQISQISRGIKILAKNLTLPILALAQLSREVEKRTTPIPKLSDLRESGSLEQDADSVVFLHRPWYFDNSEPEKLLHLLIAKNRHGEFYKQVETEYMPQYSKVIQLK